MENSNSDSAATEVEPTPSEVERIGELSAALSDLSDNIELDDDPGRIKSRGLAGWVQVIRPMIHGRFMWTLTISNLVLSILMILLIIYIIIFAVLLSSSVETKKELQRKIETVDYCSVSWHPLSNCSAKCKEVSGSRWNAYPIRSTYIDDVTGKKCPGYLREKSEQELKKLVREVPCNVWACE